MKDKYIKHFFDSARKLKEEGIMRSSKYSDDIGEHICAELYDIKPFR